MKIPHERIQEQFKATGNRLALKETAPNQPTKENFRIYGKIAGIILSFLGLARRFDALDEYGKDTTWIINKKSYKEWLTTNALAANLDKKLPISQLIQGIREHQTTLKTSRPRPDTQAKSKEVESLQSSTKPILSREYPPLGATDTLVGGKSAHPEGKKLFRDEEIVTVHEIIKTTVLFEKTGWPSIFTFQSMNNKTFLQQRSLRGCTAACAAMLILDNNKECDLIELCNRNLADHKIILRDIKKAGLTPIIFEFVKCEDLEKRISENGPGIVPINGEIGGHVIILDAIDHSTARVRDPYHGWEITISREAFEKRFDSNGYIIQVLDQKPSKTVPEINPQLLKTQEYKKP